MEATLYALIIDFAATREWRHTTRFKKEENLQQVQAQYKQPSFVDIWLLREQEWGTF